LPIAIAGAIALCQRFFHPLLYVVTVMWIGARLALPGYARDAQVTRGDLGVLRECTVMTVPRSRPG